VEEDLDRVALLLAKGFRAASVSYWQAALRKLSSRTLLEPYPRFGYVLECGDTLVGVLLTIFTAVPNGPQVTIRCNISSWYVEPEFRSYAALLSLQPKKYPGVTFLNTSPADHTWSLIEAQGFSRFADGLFVAATALTCFKRGGKAISFRENKFPELPTIGREYQLMKDCHNYGCLCFWCEADGTYYPFIVRRRLVLSRKIPCAHLIFCRDVADLTRFAGPVSRFLLAHGMPFMIIGANGPTQGLIGRFFPNRRPMYYRGEEKPRIGDLSHTEGAIFGM
jgi:hypothetical protein